MKSGLLNFLYFGVGGAFVTLVVMVVFVPFMSWGTSGTDPADGVGALSLVLAGFTSPVLLSLDWWVTVGFLGSAFWLSHGRRNPTAT